MRSSLRFRRARSQWGTPRGQCAPVPFIQRFGSALNLNVHFHTLVLDGVYSSDKSSAPRFLPLPPPSPDEVAHVLAGTARRIARLVAPRAEEDDDALTRDEPLLATLAAASLRSLVAMDPAAARRCACSLPDPEVARKILECLGLPARGSIPSTGGDLTVRRYRTCRNRSFSFLCPKVGRDEPLVETSAQVRANASEEEYFEIEVPRGVLA